MKKLSILAMILIIFTATFTKTVKSKSRKSKPVVELVFVIDRSGSMSGFEDDTIEGYNSVLKKQGKNENLIVTTVLFNTNYEILFNGISSKNAALNKNNYTVNGGTALLDAVGKTINDVKIRQNKKEKSKVIFVIITDGEENSSKEYTYDSVSKLINEQQKKGDWTFMFLGANIDASKEAAKLNIPKEQSAKYYQSKEGNKMLYESINDNISNVQENKEINFRELEKSN